MKIIIANNPENLKAANPSHTVEAEYGEVVVEGSELTLAHHGPRSDNPAPCLHPNIEANPDSIIGLSHVDLDSLGGVLAIMGIKPEGSFWKLSAFVDTQGPHKVSQFNPSSSDLDALHAFWALSQENRIFPPRDGSVEDITEKVQVLIDGILKILGGDPELIENGREFKRQEETLNKNSFLEINDGVILRQADQFVNHLYTTPEGDIGRIVISHNTKTKAVTISFAEPIEGLNCCELVQRLWGPEAGGHATIAGSPRGQEMSLEDAKELASQI